MAVEIPASPPSRSGADPESWAHYLDPDEVLLWEGAPAAGLRMRGADVLASLFGVAFLMGALFWTFMAASLAQGSELGAWFWMFGLPFIVAGVWMAVGRPFWRAWLRRRTRYALTDRRAIVASRALRRSLVSYPLDARTQVDYRPGREASIWFAQEVRRGRKGQSHTVPKGFEYLRDGDAVYRLVRQVQQQATVRRR